VPAVAAVACVGSAGAGTEGTAQHSFRDAGVYRCSSSGQWKTADQTQHTLWLEHMTLQQLNLEPGNRDLMHSKKGPTAMRMQALLHKSIALELRSM
jgi:hypothetical protein